MYSISPSLPPDYESRIASSGEEKGRQQYDSGGPNFMPLEDKRDVDLKPLKRNQSRSPSPEKENRKVSYISSYSGSDHRSTATTMKQSKSSQSMSLIY